MAAGTDIGTALSSYVQEYVAASFSWKNRNCTHFCAGWVLRVEGWDPLSLLQFGMPRSAESAVRTVSRRGGMAVLASQALQRPMVQRTLARTGDIVLLSQSEYVGALAICNGRTAVSLRAGTGVAHVPMEHACCAWHVRHIGV